MSSFTFNQIHNQRKSFIKNNKNLDYVIINGDNNVLISAPHGVSQLRNGKTKVAEIGSIASALYLQNNTNSFLIAKTKNCMYDANWDIVSNYKKALWALVKKYNIKYVLDFHGLGAWREMDINLGTNYGKNTKSNTDILKNLQQTLKKNGFVVSIDVPFAGGEKTIAGHTKNKIIDVWTLQIEVNSKITNDPSMINKYNKLLAIICDWIKQLK